MNNILAFDTTDKNAFVSCYDGNIQIDEQDENSITHSEKLLPLIHQTLSKGTLTISAVDTILVTNGPGSFTGTRIGIATAKAFAQPNHLPIYAVSSLELLAFAQYTKEKDGKEKYIFSFIDARNDRIYYALYKIQEYKGAIQIENILEIANEEMTVALDRLSTHALHHVTFTGIKKERFSEIVSQYYTLPFTLTEENETNSSYLISYFKQVDKDTVQHHATNCFELDIHYARMSQAERMKHE